MIPVGVVQMETLLLISNALGQTDTKGDSIYIEQSNFYQAGHLRSRMLKADQDAAGKQWKFDGDREGAARRSIAALCPPTSTFALWIPGTLQSQGRTSSTLALTGKPITPGIQTSVFAWKCPERSSRV